MTNDSSSEPIIAIKGFERDMTCRGFQYKEGETYKHDGDVVRCAEGGFHAIEGHPLDVFNYYPPAASVYHIVECGGAIDRAANGGKIACGEITIRGEIRLPEIIDRAINYVVSRAGTAKGSSATGDYGASSATGYQGASSATGNFGASSATGYRGASSATGYRGASSATGYRGASSATGDRGASSATGYRGASSATGDYGASSATGDQGASSATGNFGASSATGTRGAAMAIGENARVMGAAGNALFLVERDDDGDIIHAWAGIVGRDGIQPNAWYSLKGGKPVEVEV